MSDRSKEQILKEALSSSSRAISSKTDLELNFGSDSIHSNSIPLPESSLRGLSLSRAKADKIALKEKFSNESRSEITGINELDQSLSVQNSVRIEVLGSLQYKGLKSNLRNNFVEELEAFKPESAIESINKILDIWIKGKILGNRFTALEEKILEPFSEDLKKVEKKFIPELKKNIKDKGLYLESIQNLLKELNIKF